MSGLAIFDLDGTLIDCNSGRLWVAHEVRGRRLSVWDGVKAAWWLARYARGHADLSGAYEAAAARLRGVREADLDARVRAWFAVEVAHRMRRGAASALEAHRRRGDVLLLATSSSPYAAAAAVSAFGLDEAVATEFETRDGVFTGRIGSSAFGPDKATKVASWAAARGLDLATASFYSDSASDLPLFRRVRDPVAVHPDRLLRKVARAEGWRIENWDVATASDGVS